MATMVQKRQKTQIRRQQIINALRKLIIKGGSENVTVARIAKEIGVTQGAIYRHFRSKREILGFLIDHIRENLLGDLERFAEHSSVLDFLESVLRSHISVIEQRKGISFLVVAEIVSLGDKKLNRRIYEVLTEYITHLKEILLRGIESKELKQRANPEIVATIFFSVLQGFISLWALSDSGFNLEDRYSELWDFFRQAVAR